MAELLDDVSYLSQEVGPRPAGTEEEQQAALYIADKVHQRTGFHAELEDIKCTANAELVDCLYFGLAFVCLLVAFLFPGSSIVTFALALVCAVLYVLERVQKRAILSRVFTRDISQNVVVKYKPGTESARMAGQPRKIVVVANYDSGRVRREAKPRLVGAYTFFMKAGAVCMVASPLLILLRNIVLAGSLGVVSAVLSLLVVVALVFLLIPLVFFALHRFAPFNEGANNNASSIAVMLEVLRRIDGTAAPENAPRPRKAPEEEPVVHGERAAREAGVVPQGASLQYDDGLVPESAVDGDAPQAAYANDFTSQENNQVSAQGADAVDDDSAAGRLRSAKAAIAALTGEDVHDRIFLDFDAPASDDAADSANDAPAVQAPEAPDSEEGLASPVTDEAEEAASVAAAAGDAVEGAAAALAAEAASAATYAAAKAPAVPDWYAAAQAKAHRRVAEPARRSRYADALDSAVRESSSHFQRANSLVDEETEQRLRQMRESFASPAAEPDLAPSNVPAPEAPATDAPVSEAFEPQNQDEPLASVQPQAEPDEPELDSTAAFPPVGAQGQTVEFEPEFDLDANEVPVQPAVEEAAPQPMPGEPLVAADDEGAADAVDEAAVFEDEPLEADYEVIDAELVEEYAEDEYDEYSDADEGRSRRETLPSRRRSEKTSRAGGFFSRLRDAVVPPAANDFEDDSALDEEPLAAAQPLADALDADEAVLPETAAEAAAVTAESPATPEEAPEADADEAYEEDYYDDEPSRFADLRERMSGAFTRFTSRIAPAPDYEEQDYSYDENEGYRFDDYDEPEPPLAPGQAPVAVADAFIDDEVQAPVPVTLPNEQVPDNLAEPPAAQDEQTVFVEDAPEPDEPAFEPLAAASDFPADAAANEIDPDAEEYYDEWEDGDAGRGGFMGRISGFWNRIVGRNRDDYEYEDDAYDFADNEPQEEAVQETVPQLADEPHPAGELVYQTAYAPVRTKMKRTQPPVPVADEELPAEEPVSAEEPAPANDEAVAEEGQPVAYDDAPDAAFDDADMSFQQVVVQGASDEEVEAPIATPSSSASVSSQARPANPRARRGARVPAVSPWEKVASPGSTAPFTVPITPDTTAPFQQIPEYMETLPGAASAAAPADDRAEDALEEAVEAQAPAVEAQLEEPIEPAAQEPAEETPAPVQDLADAREEVAQPPIIPVFEDEDDEFAPLSGETTAFAPIDVSNLGDAAYPAPVKADDEQPSAELEPDFAVEVEPDLLAPAPVNGDEDAVPASESEATPPLADAELPFGEAAEVLLDEPDPAGRVKLPEIPLESKQHAPLADAPITDQMAARSRLSSAIPVIDVARPQPQPVAEPSREELSRTERMRRLHTSLPSMSGSISSDPRFANGENSLVSQTGSFAAVSATGNIDPVGDELVEDVPPEEIYVDDADDSLYQEGGVTETGAYTAPDYVQMPQKRRGLFGRRRERKAVDETTPQQWLGVSDDFDARTVGKARGDWSSFQENDARASVGNRVSSAEQPTMGWRADRNTPDSHSDYDTGLDSAFIDDEDDFLGEDHGMNNGRWNGGAFSGRRAGERDRYAVDDNDQWAEFAEYADENYDENAFLNDADYDDEGAAPEPEQRGGRLRGLASRFSRKDKDAGDSASRRASRGEDEPPSRASRREPAYTPGENDAWNVAAARAAARSAVVNVMDDPRVQEELGETYGFVDDPIANEVWFVALGAGLSDNAGMREFLDAHADELRGAMVINLEGIGDGELVGMASEGLLKQYKPTTRMKRFLRNAGQATGVRVGQAKMNWRDSAATVAMRRGISTITVAGVDGNVPLRYGSSDDVVEKLDEATLKQRVNFVLELLRTI